MTYFSSTAMYWMKQLFLIKTIFIKNGVPFLMSIFRSYARLEFSVEHISVRKSLFLHAVVCSDARAFFTRPKIWIWWNHRLWLSYLEYMFCHSEVLRLHAILHDAAAAVRPHSGKRPGLCYMIRRGPTSCLLGHVTGQLLCLYVKHNLRSTFNPVYLWSGVSCLALDIELSDEYIIRKLRVFSDGNVQDYSFCPPKKYKPTKQAFWCRRDLRGAVWNSGCLDYSELATFLDGAAKGESFALSSEKCKVLGTLKKKQSEILDDHGCLKVQGFEKQMKNCGFAQVIFSDKRQFFTAKSGKKIVW